MNTQKARAIRQLVKHLQSKGRIENKVWVEYNVDRMPHETLPKVYNTEAANQMFNGESIKDTQDKWLTMAAKRERYIVPTVTLNPTCGRAIYQQMKKRAQNGLPISSAK
jgi:hypothetical protein